MSNDLIDPIERLGRSLEHLQAGRTAISDATNANQEIAEDTETVEMLANLDKATRLLRAILRRATTRSVPPVE